MNILCIYYLLITISYFSLHYPINYCKSLMHWVIKTKELLLWLLYYLI